LLNNAVAKWLDPDWGIKVNSGYMGWRAGTTTLRLYPSVMDL
jgi:hypothetical protein